MTCALEVWSAHISLLEQTVCELDEVNLTRVSQVTHVCGHVQCGSLVADVCSCGTLAGMWSWPQCSSRSVVAQAIKVAEAEGERSRHTLFERLPSGTK
eukprot:4915826-Amphidinium_carterae.1